MIRIEYEIYECMDGYVSLMSKIYYTANDMDALITELRNNYSFDKRINKLFSRKFKNTRVI